jgi:hypothetical protein
MSDGSVNVLPSSFASSAHTGTLQSPLLKSLNVLSPDVHLTTHVLGL